MSTPDLSPVGEVQAPPRFRKKPLEIEAMQFTEATAEAVVGWSGATPFAAGVDWETGAEEDGYLIIATLEGPMRASLGDWIIRGIKGEFYPCRADIFAATYDVAPEPLELTPAEQAAKEKSEHMSTCHEEACVECMRELRVIRRIVKAIRPHIAEEQAKTVDRLRTALERVAEELEEEGHTAQLDSAFRIREALAPVAAASNPAPDGGLVDVRD